VQGEGFFGTVYKAQAHGLTVLGKWSTVAVKMIKNDRTVDKRTKSSLHEEAKLLCELGRFQHKNVVQLLGICSRNEPFLLIEEYAQHGNLKTHLRSIKNIGISHKSLNSSKNGLREDKMIQFALDIAKGMEYLMKKKVNRHIS
jgi:serine/threonine protein kinase